jgi:hypothetical protein
MRRNVAAGVCGLLGVSLNIVAVALLSEVPHTYKPHTFALWLTEARAVPTQTSLSAWAFTFGLLSLAVFAAALPVAVEAERPAAFRAGTAWLVLGALMNAVGTLAPVLALEADDAVARTLLHATLLLDSTFNACLGVALLHLGFAAGKVWPRALRLLCVVAGLTSLPVALQFTSTTAAGVLAIAGPLWLAALSWVSWLLIRGAR